MSTDIEFHVYGRTVEEINANADAECERIAPGVQFRPMNLMIEMQALMANSGQVITYDATVRARITQPAPPPPPPNNPSRR